MLFLTVVLGVTGFMLIEELSFVNALYMTVITMSTVGFETVSHGPELTDPGKIFVVFLITFTIGSFFYTITNLTTFVVEGEMRSLLKLYRVNKEVNKLRDHIIICGCGRNGKEAVLELLEQKIPFVVIENDQQTIDEFLDVNKVLVVKGDATKDEALAAANIRYAKGVITTLPEDADNVFVTLTAKELNPRVKIVSRAGTETSISKLRTAGATRVVVPNMIGGRKMAKMLTKPALIDFVDMITGEGDMDMHLEVVDCSVYRNLVGRTLAELHIRKKTGVLVLGFQGAEAKLELNPPPDRMVSKESKLFILGKTEQLATFRSFFSPEGI